MPLSTTSSESLPDHIRRLARTAEVAGYGSDDVMTDWLRVTAHNLRRAAQDLDDYADGHDLAAAGELVGSR